MEDHITILKEPESIYLGHLTATSGTGQQIATEILRFLGTKNFDVNELNGIGCDGTVINTGNKNGAIACLEQQLKKPLQWLIRHLHSNELPLRHLIVNIVKQTLDKEN